MAFPAPASRGSVVHEGAQTSLGHRVAFTKGPFHDCFIPRWCRPHRLGRAEFFGEDDRAGKKREYRYDRVPPMPRRRGRFLDREGECLEKKFSGGVCRVFSKVLRDQQRRESHTLSTSSGGKSQGLWTPFLQDPKRGGINGDLTDEGRDPALSEKLLSNAEIATS